MLDMLPKRVRKKRRKPQNIQAAFCLCQLSIDPIILITKKRDYLRSQ